MPTIDVTHVGNARYHVAIGRHHLTVDQPKAAGGDDEAGEGK